MYLLQEEPTPSAPPFPDSLPDYYEFMSQEHEQMYTQEQPHQLLEEEVSGLVTLHKVLYFTPTD